MLKAIAEEERIITLVLVASSEGKRIATVSIIEVVVRVLVAVED